MKETQRTQRIPVRLNKEPLLEAVWEIRFQGYFCKDSDKRHAVKSVENFSQDRHSFFKSEMKVWFRFVIFLFFLRKLLLAFAYVSVKEQCFPCGLGLDAPLLSTQYIKIGYVRLRRILSRQPTGVNLRFRYVISRFY